MITLSPCLHLQALSKELAEHHATTDLSDIHLLVKVLATNYLLEQTLTPDTRQLTP